MKKLIHSILIFSIATSLFAQDTDIDGQYIFDQYMINPAAAGSKPYEPFALSFKKLWAGVDESPITYSFLTHRPLNDRMSVGAQLYGYEIGPTSKLGMGLSYAYSVPIVVDKAKLSFGLSFLLYQYGLQKDGLLVEDPSDPLIQGGNENSMLIDANFGTYFETKEIYAGFVIPQMVSHNVDSVAGIVGRFQLRSLYLHGGYRYKINRDNLIEPSLLAKASFGGEYQIDLNVLYKLKEQFIIGLNYKSMESLGIIIGIELPYLYAAYFYDFGTSNIARYSNGSHELIIAYKLAPSRRSRFGPRSWGFRAR